MFKKELLSLGLILGTGHLCLSCSHTTDKAKETKSSETSVTSEIKVNTQGKFFSDSRQEIEIEMATIEEKNADGLQDVLLKISGAAAKSEGIDGKVFRYKAVPAGTGVNFEYEADGQPAVRMLIREDFRKYEAFVNNKKFNVYSSPDKDKKVKVADLLSQFKKNK